MALVLADRVLETCTSPGTGAVTLLGATTGYQTFGSAIGNGNTCYYAIADQSGANWEVGIGTYASSGNTLTRTTPLSGSAATPVNFSSGTQNVFVTYPAEKSVNLNASGNVSALGTISSGTWQGTAITDTYLATISTAGKVSNSATTATDANTSNAIVARDASGNFSAGTITATLSGTATNVSGTVAILNGGTGQTTASAAFNALSPVTTTGDLIIGNGTNSATRLAIGANTYLLTSNGTTASWQAPPAAGVTQAKATALAMIFGL